MKKRQWLRRALRIIIGIFIFLNVLAAIHAWSFTHFATSGVRKITDTSNVTGMEKLGIVFTGLRNPRPVNTALPSHPYSTVKLQSNRRIECWHIPHPNSIGTVIIFHGYGGKKSGMLDRANKFYDMGYATLLVDLMGAGGSEGRQCTIGFLEAEQVKTCYDFIDSLGEKKIWMLGLSMGAASIMRCMKNEQLKVQGLILEVPFGSMYKTTAARFRAVHAPTFPMAALLVTWGGWLNGFNAWSHNPAEYAAHISCPVLLMYGEKDIRVSRAETDEIFHNLKGEKTLKLFAHAGHENYLAKYLPEWMEATRAFMKKTQ